MTPAEFKKIRRSLKFTQERLAKTLSVSTRQLQRWEKGDKLIDENIAFRVETMARALGLL